MVASIAIPFEMIDRTNEGARADYGTLADIDDIVVPASAVVSTMVKHIRGLVAGGSAEPIVGDRA